MLHALLGRLAPLGITHLEDLATATDPVPSDVRRKRTLADGLPDAPGVYLFRRARRGGALRRHVDDVHPHARAQLLHGRRRSAAA